MARSEANIQEARQAVQNELRATEPLAGVKFPDEGSIHQGVIARVDRLKGMRYALDPQTGVSDLPSELSEGAIRVLHGIEDAIGFKRGRRTEVSSYVRNFRGK